MIFPKFFLGLAMLSMLGACANLPDAGSLPAAGASRELARPTASVTPATSRAVRPATLPSRPASPAAQPLSEKQLIAAVDGANNVFFPPDGTAVNDAGRSVLAAYAARLKADPELQVILVGHTDDLGSPSYNLAIAEQRVNAVYAILRGLGVPMTQIRRYGVGNEKVELACQSIQCQSKMRRVELVIEQ